jgi:hypothetical protein
MNNSQDSVVSNLLRMSIKRYQFDVVGWTEYCIENKYLNQKAFPIYRHKPLEHLLIQDKIFNPLSTPSIKKVYESPQNYIKYLDAEYIRDQAFYEAVIKNPGKFKMDNNDIFLNKEIDHSARKYLETIEKRKIDEKMLIRCIENDKWLDIKMSKYPKVQLGLILGASNDAIVKNFGIFFINQLKAQFVVNRTAFLSSTGPASWNELEQCKAELKYFKKEVVDPAVKILK